jgi:hypothetical protein
VSAQDKPTSILSVLSKPGQAWTEVVQEMVVDFPISVPFPNETSTDDPVTFKLEKLDSKVIVT